VGGSFGQSALRFADAFPEAHIYTFKPVPQLFKSLSAATSQISRIAKSNFGFGEENKFALIGLAQDLGANNLLIAKDSTETCEVEIQTLDRFVTENGVENIDLLETDVEG